MSTPPNEGREGRSPYVVWGISALVVIALLAAAVVILALSRFGGSGEQTLPPSPPPSSSGTSPSTDPTATSTDGCNLPATDQTVPRDSAPAAITWTPDATEQVALPTGTEAGPQRFDQFDIGQCFARTPTGALLAATHAQAILSTSSDFDRIVDMLKTRCVDNPAREDLIAGFEGAAPTSGVAASARVRGYKFLSYDQDRAVVQVAFQQSVNASPRVTMGTLTLQWAGDDWKIDIAESATADASETEVADLTTWGQ